MNQDNRNMVLFLAIAALILVGWPIVSQSLFPQPKRPPVARTQPGTPTATPPAGTATSNATAPAVDATKVKRDRAVVLAETPRVAITTPAVKGSINLKGARLDDLVLLRHKETIKKNAPPVRLLSPSGAADSYFAGFGWAGDGVALPDKNTVWTADSAVLTPGKPVTLSWANPQGLRFQIKIAVDDGYLFTIEQAAANATAAPVTLRPYGLISRTGASKDVDTWVNHVGPIGVFGVGANYDIGYPDLKGVEPGFFDAPFGTSVKAGANYFDAKGGWLGFGDLYWLAALVPDQNAQVHAGFRAAGDVFQADYASTPVKIAPGKIARTSSRFFAGAKEVRLIDKYQDDGGIVNFDKAIDWGWFQIIEKPIFYYLDILFRLTTNFGVAIILLTLTIRGLLFPIAQRQFASMAKMKAIQPKQKAIQERYKDDKPRQQQEIMALYKTEGVNPLGGCGPTLLQIPIMYALYKVLLLSTEMRHQPFVLWIRDLAAPDPLTPINLFGLLPFTPPVFIAIGIIPILLGVSMYFQFKLNPAPMDEAQKQVFAIMPWMLMFVMAPFAVGLQLYWITSNVLTILQQRMLYARHPEMLVPAPAKK
ncbi:membrane protein insertase YidC [Sphingomonas sp. 28-62-11]|uniref:membrane protein insertase YidC n=1 Tax=Sphingomonas sp. 28-62-11 TaxID=1970432 RepID=UPI000BCE8193|nr:MAG: membrane protein insertase YidC [Sphingomonas sp. 28-62-11]